MKKHMIKTTKVAVTLAKARPADEEAPGSLDVGLTGLYCFEGTGMPTGTGIVLAATGTGRGTSGCILLYGMIPGGL